MLEDYVLVADAAAELGMSRDALWKAIQRHRLPVRRVGRAILIHRSHLEEFRQNKPKRGYPKGRPRKTPRPPP